MTSKNIIKAVKELGGVIIRESEKEVFGVAQGYDIEYIGGSNFVTIRKTSKRGEYDQGSDYNPGGYVFLNRIKDISRFILS